MKVPAFLVTFAIEFTNYIKMELTGNNGEIADFILHTMKEKDGYMRRDDLATMLTDKYGWDTDAPDIVLDALENDYSFITRNGEVLRLTKEGDKVARLGVAAYFSKEDTKEKRNEAKEWMSIGKIIFDILIAAASFVLGRCSAGV